MSRRIRKDVFDETVCRKTYDCPRCGCTAMDMIYEDGTEQYGEGTLGHPWILKCPTCEFTFEEYVTGHPDNTKVRVR